MTGPSQWCVWNIKPEFFSLNVSWEWAAGTKKLFRYLLNVLNNMSCLADLWLNAPAVLTNAAGHRVLLFQAQENIEKKLNNCADAAHWFPQRNITPVIYRKNSTFRYISKFHIKFLFTEFYYKDKRLFVLWSFLENLLKKLSNIQKYYKLCSKSCFNIVNFKLHYITFLYIVQIIILRFYYFTQFYVKYFLNFIWLLFSFFCHCYNLWYI